MSRRIAHRPRYRNLHHFAQSSRSTQQEFFPRHWTYRRQPLFYPRPVLGQGLLLIPFQCFVHNLSA